jgi:acetyl esterase/lipase
MTSADLPSLTAPPPDHRIQYGPGPLQFGNLRLPKTPGRHAVVVLIHGGCWLSQYDIAHLAAAEQAIADAGYAVWSLEYRRVGDDGGGWPGTFTDVASGADYLRVLAPKYSLDLSRVVASGHSAGGQLALWLAARKRIPRTSELYSADPIAVQGVLGLSPAPDLEALDASGACGNAVHKLMGGSPAQYPDRYAAASPMKLAPIAIPQTLVIGAHDDDWGPGGRSYFARAKAVGDTAVHIIDAPESGHFELIAPKTTTWPIVAGALQALFARIGR